MVVGEPIYLRNAVIESTGNQPSTSPVEEDTWRREKYCAHLNIYSSEDFEIDSCPPTDCGSLSNQHCKARNPVKLEGQNRWFNLKHIVFVSQFISLTLGSKLQDIFICMFLVMSLTPRHLLSVIQYLYMGFYCKTRGRFLILFFAVCSLPNQSGAGELVTSNQPLPSKCKAWFTDLDCPIKAEWSPSWDNGWMELNKTCCSGFPGTQLHCQRDGMSNFPACLMDQIVPKGHTGKLSKDGKGNPQFEIVPCNSMVAFESDETVSSNITFPYCLRSKSKCQGEGQELLCQGGTDTDDKCTCSEGYKPHGCAGIFTDEGECWCEPVNCPASQIPVRTPIESGLCVDVIKEEFTMHFGCENSSVVTVPPAEGSVKESSMSGNTPPGVSYPTVMATDDSSGLSTTKDGMNSFYNVIWWIIVIVAVIFLVFLVGMALIARFIE